MRPSAYQDERLRKQLPYTAEEATAFMEGEAYRTNPIGIPFDPEEFVARVRSGESHASIKKRADFAVAANI